MLDLKDINTGNILTTWITLLVLLAFVSFIGIKSSKKEYIHHRKEYPFVTVRDSINNYCLSIFPTTKYFKYSATIISITLNNGVKCAISAHYRNQNGQRIGIHDYLKQNDNIVKRSDSDTVFIYRNNSNNDSMTYFILDSSVINK
jgi:hypothetical protein